MKMTALKELHASMLSIGVDMQKFRVRTGGADFDCLFSTRDAPFSLALTLRGANPIFLLFEVRKGYFISDYLGDQYPKLKEALYRDGETGEALVPKNWLQQLNQTIPREANGDSVPNSTEVVQLRPDLEESDRPYFDTWIYWQKGSGPTAKNKKKTLYMLGKEALAHSEKHNASSKWSSQPTGRGWI